jgi:L-aspartate oxidase
MPGIRTDLLVVGAGVAGLTAAIAAAEAGLAVTVVYKPAPAQPEGAGGAAASTATAYAQGGIAVVDRGDPMDSVARHIADTLAAGGPLVDPVATESILTAGPAAVERLISWGGRFDSGEDGRLRRTREGGHTAARIIHAGGDATGAEVQRALLAAASRHRITTHPGHVTALLRDGDRIVGARVLGPHGSTSDLHAPTVLLATGGAGHLYSATTNPLGSTADGIALAITAGARTRDLQYMQFHPTMLFTPGIRGRRSLISEAVRGEGARLLDTDGRSVTAGVHPMGDLAPRDVVSRAVTDAMARTGAAHVWLDARSIPQVTDRFPTVTAAVRAIGLDPARDLIPVAPGAHYLCGGVVTDLRGATTVPGLSAAGEVARTGLHGANRLASNSLLEALVMGLRVAREASGTVGRRSRAAAPVPMPEARADRTALQDAMTALAGVYRTRDGLARLCARLDDPEFAPDRPAWSGRDHEDRALTAVARTMSAEALAGVPKVEVSV